MSNENTNLQDQNGPKAIEAFKMSGDFNAYATGYNPIGDVTYVVAMADENGPLYTVRYMPTFGMRESGNIVGYIDYPDGRSTHVFASGATGKGDVSNPESAQMSADFKKAVDTLNREPIVIVPAEIIPVSADEIRRAAEAIRDDNLAFIQSLKTQYGSQAPAAQASAPAAAASPAPMAP